MIDMDPDISLGEVARRVDRMDAEMRAGFQSMHEQMQRLAFVPAAVYAADRSGDQERIRRLERDLEQETKEREAYQTTADQRAWQSRWSIIMAMIGLPLSIIGSVVVALLLGTK